MYKENVKHGLQKNEPTTTNLIQSPVETSQVLRSENICLVGSSWTLIYYGFHRFLSIIQVLLEYLYYVSNLFQSLLRSKNVLENCRYHKAIWSLKIKKIAVVQGNRRLNQKFRKPSLVSLDTDARTGPLNFQSQVWPRSLHIL